MDWLPLCPDFRERLRAAAAMEPAAQVEALRALAQYRLGFIEQIQLDHALRRLPASTASQLESVALALLSSHTVEHLLPHVRVAALRRGLSLSVRHGAFGQYRRELLDPASPLADERLDFIALSLGWSEFLGDLQLAATGEQVDAAIAAAVEQLEALWRCAQQRWHATVIQQSFLDATEPLFGSLDRLVPGAPSNLISRLNDRAATAAQASGVIWLDLSRVVARAGLDTWFDEGRWLQAKMEIAPAAAAGYGELMARLIAAQRGRSRKCLVLDLDNTLWGGVIGDDGLQGITLGQGSAQGEAHLALQRYAKQLKQRGIVLAVCSKNDPQTAIAAFRDHTEMLLVPEDISVFVANWDDKAENLVRIASRLNLGLDSLVFVDDNPVERERVRQALPMVAVPELPADPALYVRCIAAAGYFEAVAFTAEDRARTDQYTANAQRDLLRDASTTLEDFLQSLQMTATAGVVQPADVARAVQLVNKTNQFNTTMRRLSSEEFELYLKSANRFALQFRLRDRFGDNGLVSVMLLGPSPQRATLQIDSWVMSCRVFGRQLEDEVLNFAAGFAAEHGYRYLAAQFRPSAKNAVVADLYARLGFDPEDSHGADGTQWVLKLDHYRPRPTFIRRSNT